MIDFPEPLFESFLPGDKLCLVCGNRPAVRALWTTQAPIVPLCDDCRGDWNLHGYLALRTIKPGRLVTRLIRYKLLHPMRGPSIAVLRQDLRNFAAWVRRMKKFR